MTAAGAIAWSLFIVFCPIDRPCRIHVATYDKGTSIENKADCYAALRLLAQPVEPDGRKSVRQMVCAREVHL